MKNTILLACLCLMIGSTAIAQSEKPKKEFLVVLSETSIALKPGESKELSINLLRSNAFAKSKAKLGVSSALPTGITLVFEPSEGVIESSVAKISVAAETKPGTYTILPNCLMNNKSKGTMLKVTVMPSNGTVTGK